MDEDDCGHALKHLITHICWLCRTGGVIFSLYSSVEIRGALVMLHPSFVPPSPLLNPVRAFPVLTQIEEFENKQKIGQKLKKTATKQNLKV